MFAAGCQKGRKAVIDRKSYRDAMARLGAAVNIITTTGADGPRGFTASAVCSVTDDPPTLLLCVNRTSDSHDPLKANGVLCVNTLSASQENLSGIFAGMTGMQGPERFQHGEWTTLETGSPALRDAVVSFDCKIVDVTEVGTHTVFFCEVLAIQTGALHEGLIYFGRAYHRLVVEVA
jgi:flavin reductase